MISDAQTLTASTSLTDGWGETVHKRWLLNPDEIGRRLARIDDRNHPDYPGIVVALIPGDDPMLVRRINYFESPRFAGFFDPHPDHRPPRRLVDYYIEFVAREAARALASLPIPAQLFDCLYPRAPVATFSYSPPAAPPAPPAPKPRNKFLVWLENVLARIARWREKCRPQQLGRTCKLPWLCTEWHSSHCRRHLCRHGD